MIKRAKLVVFIMKLYPYLKSSFIFIGFSLATAILSGCWAAVGAGAGASTVAYIDGSVKDNVDASLESVHSAALKACEELQYKVTSESKDAKTVEIIARTGKDEKIKIDLAFLTEKATEVKIRVGVFGDEALSIDLLEAIKKSLK